MHEYTYTLQDNDYIEYLENQASENKMIFYRSLLFTYGSVPILACAVYAMGIRKLPVYCILLLLFLAWIPVSKKIIGKVFRTSIEKKLEETGKRNYRQMTVQIDHRDVQVTSEKQKTSDQIASYQAFGHLLVLQLAGGSQLLLPSRIFPDEKDLADLLKEIKGE